MFNWLQPPRIYLKVGIDQIEARLADGTSTTVRAATPFSTPRLLVGNFAPFEAAVKEALARTLGPRGFLRQTPQVIVQPMARNEGGLSEIERRVLQEAASAAGARQCWVREGAVLTDAQISTFTPPAAT